MKKVCFNADICIVIHGPITYIDNIIKTYSGFTSNVIISTNEDSTEILNRLTTNGFTVLSNELAEIPGTTNFNNQVKNTFEGIKKSKEMGFKYVLKIRSDIFFDDLCKFINLLDGEKIYFSAYHNYDGGYLCEHMLFGSTDFMLKLWDIPLSSSNLPPETQLTQKYEEINDGRNIDFLFPILYNYDIKAYWSKYRMFLNEYENDKLFSYEKK
jgi:hypothetical protein